MRSGEYLEKYRKLVKALRILCRIGCWGSAVLVVVLLPLAIMLMTRDNIGINFADNLRYADGVIRYKLSVAAGMLTALEMARISAQILLSVVVYSTVVGTILFYLSGILASVEKGSPFTKETARRISAMAIIFAVGSFFVGVAQANTANVIIHAMGLTDSLAVNYSVNNTMLLTGLLLLILSGIFRYGSYLQEEYDATL